MKIRLLKLGAAREKRKGHAPRRRHMASRMEVRDPGKAAIELTETVLAGCDRMQRAVE
jgi:hypothetical protein